MNGVFLEIVVNAADAAAIGIESRDEIETPLEEALLQSGVGEVTGGGRGGGVYIVDIEIASEDLFAQGLIVIRRVLQSLSAPTSTMIKRHKPKQITFPVYDPPR